MHMHLNPAIIIHVGLCFMYKQIGDLTSLRESSHKFEACYTDNLVGEELFTHLYGRWVSKLFSWSY
jgi:hypothetical protein